MAKFKLKKTIGPYRLGAQDKGPHRFGGPATHKGVIPIGTELLCTISFHRSV